MNCDLCQKELNIDTARATRIGLLCADCFQSSGEASEYMNLTEAAKLLGISKPTLSRWLKAGKVKAYRLGKAYRIPRTEIYKQIEST